MAPPSLNTLPAPKRYILTAHDAAGVSKLSIIHPTDLDTQTDPTGNVRYTTTYTTIAPLTLQSDADLDSYTRTLTEPIYGLFYPESGSAQAHRSRTRLDNREIELEWDGGDKKVVGKRDVVVQRGTMHIWRNLSETEWARFLAVMFVVQRTEVAGNELVTEIVDGLDVVPE